MSCPHYGRSFCQGHGVSGESLLLQVGNTGVRRWDSGWLVGGACRGQSTSLGRQDGATVGGGEEGTAGQAWGDFWSPPPSALCLDAAAVPQIPLKKKQSFNWTVAGGLVDSV